MLRNFKEVETFAEDTIFAPYNADPETKICCNPTHSHSKLYGNSL